MAVTAREYLETLAREVGRSRGGLVLSPADAQLALAWHAAGLPLAEVLALVKKGFSALKSKGGGRARGALELPVSLSAVRGRVEGLLAASRKSQARLAQLAGPRTLSQELLSAAQVPGLPARPAWTRLAAQAEDLLRAGVDGYWSGAIAAVRESLKALPRSQRLAVGTAVRARRGRRPSSVSPARYKRSLQLQMLSAASELFGVPPKAFLL